MLSIRFDDEREWWVGGTEFHRLFQACLEAGAMPSRLAHWGDIADANGGLSVTAYDLKDRQDFEGVLLPMAQQEIGKLGPESGSPADTTYRTRLAALVALLQQGP